MPGSRPRAGGKIVADRRRQRLASTPYDRPPAAFPSRSPNWITSVLIPSARALASGAGKILSSAILSDSETSSSEDLNSASEDDINNIHDHESPYVQINALNEEKLTSSAMMPIGRDSQFTLQRTETKLLIERLIMQENFSREECDKLIKVLSSRVVDWSPEAGKSILLANSPGRTVDHEDVYVSSKAVLEAKKWIQEKIVRSSSVAELAHGTCNLSSTVLDHIESGVGSPVDVARSYMRDRPTWASPTENVEFRTPLTTRKNLFKEETPYSVSHDILSSSKRQNSLASGSWNIQEELRKVRSKAIDDMLRTRPSKVDSSLIAVAPTSEQPARAGKVVAFVGERISGAYFSQETEPNAVMDVGGSSGPTLVALESRQDGKANEAPSSNPDASVIGNNEDPEALWIDVEYAPSKCPYPTSSSRTGEQHSDPHSTKINSHGPSGAEAGEFGGRLYINGFSSSQSRLSPRGDMAQCDEKNHNDNSVIEKREENIVNVEGHCELLSEAFLEVPIVNESSSIASDSQISLDVESVQGCKLEPTTRKHQGRKPSNNSRRGRGSSIGK